MTSRESAGTAEPVRGKATPLERSPSGRVRTLERRDGAACDGIIASLPDWFGMAEGIRDCARDVRAQVGLVFERGEDVIGFLTYVPRSATITEITWMAVHAHDRGHGIGTALVADLVDRLSAAGVRKLLVQTLSDREDPGPEYAATRAFYLARGFVPAAELERLSPENPIQLMSRRI